jgi:hypothetical protein
MPLVSPRLLSKSSLRTLDVSPLIAVSLEIRMDSMGTKVKPVQPTEIKDKEIIREVIAQIRRPISPEVIKRNKEIDELIDKMIKK